MTLPPAPARRSQSASTPALSSCRLCCPIRRVVVQHLRCLSGTTTGIRSQTTSGGTSYLQPTLSRHRFLQWVFFGGEGIIAENSRDEQRKAIKYNHLVANCLIFHNLCSLTRLVRKLEQRGEPVPEDAIAAISPYLTEHINRFGDYVLNLDRKPPQPDYGYTLSHSDRKSVV